jgi:hypothetical protein
MCRPRFGVCRLGNKSPAVDIYPAMPSLTLSESAGLVRLELTGIARGQGSSLQEAGDDLIGHVLVIVHAFRSSGFRVSTELRPDFEIMDFVCELGKYAAAGGDIREVVFG